MSSYWEMDLMTITLCLLIMTWFCKGFDVIRLKENNKINGLAAFSEVFEDLFPIDFHLLSSSYSPSVFGCLNLCTKTNRCSSISYTQTIGVTNNCKALHVHDANIFKFEMNLKEYPGWNTYVVLEMPSVDTFPVHGGWSEWQESGSCTLPCGGGSIKLRRLCDSPQPANNGLPCFGIDKTARNCNEHPCPVSGSWSAWTSFGSCSKTCGNGEQVLKRSCDNPRPAHGGSQCSGSNEKTVSCIRQPCTGVVNFLNSPGNLVYARSHCTLFKADATRLDLLPRMPPHLPTGYWWMDCSNGHLSACNCGVGHSTMVFYDSKAKSVSCTSQYAQLNGAICV